MVDHYQFKKDYDNGLYDRYKTGTYDVTFTCTFVDEELAKIKKTKPKHSLRCNNIHCGRFVKWWKPFCSWKCVLKVIIPWS